MSSYKKVLLLIFYMTNVHPLIFYKILDGSTKRRVDRSFCQNLYILKIHYDQVLTSKFGFIDKQFPEFNIFSPNNNPNHYDGFSILWYISRRNFEISQRFRERIRSFSAQNKNSAL